MSLSIFSSIQNYRPEDRYELNTLAKSLWNDRSMEERRQVYGNWVDLYTYEPDISKSDICLLTYHWNHYVEKGRIDQAQAEVDAARVHGKPIVIFSGGDYPANVPFGDVILFESAGYRSTPGLRYHSAQPSYISDYLQAYCGGELKIRPKQAEPVIGFCGLASISPIHTYFRMLRLKHQQCQYRKDKRIREPPPFETSDFRKHVLHQFEDKPGIKTNFIVRGKYWGGRDDKSMDNSVRIEFVNNILDSDYTLCMRGGGNFSVRFYETLCLGRIPIFIDTDCLLPFQDQIDYQAIFPWIDVKDLEHAPEIVRDFHARLSADDFIATQKLCRWLWQSHMTPDGFYQDLAYKLKELTQPNPSLR